jgi:hypothetical protein
LQDFYCPNCGQQLTFENTSCLRCGSEVGFAPQLGGFALAGAGLYRCANAGVAACNWLVEHDGWLCRSCALTRTRPADSDYTGLAEYVVAEAAKRRLIHELDAIRLPITDRYADPEGGLCFDLLSSEHAPVSTGHDSGVITLDLAESDDVHREQLRKSMDEPYRTLLGHFRHEIGHYYFTVLVRDGDRADFVRLFGDPDADYQAALDRHYSQGAPPNWEERYVSAYATMHPAEDWAETFAHYLHIRDTLDTAAAFAFAPSGVAIGGVAPTDRGFDRIIEVWLPLTWSLNMLNRSMGYPDLYPFVLTPPVLDKLRYAHGLIQRAVLAG